MYSKWVVRIKVCKRHHRPEVSGLLLVFVVYTQLERQKNSIHLAAIAVFIRADSILVSNAGQC